jgi:hypothetical protein
VCYAESRKVLWVYWTSRVVREALVTLLRMVLVRWETALLGRKQVPASYRTSKLSSWYIIGFGIGGVILSWK